MYVMGETITQQFRPLVKNLPALPAALIVRSLKSLDIFAEVKIVEVTDLESLPTNQPLILPDEDVSREVAQRYLMSHQTTFESIFLRRDAQHSLHQVEVKYDCAISSEVLDQQMMNLAQTYAQRSSDFWRQIGVVLVKDNKVLMATYNHHVPSPQTPYVFGDPRGNFNKGLHIEISTAFHGEASLIAMAARRGLALEGAHLYVTTYPCPPCAKLIAYSGITRLYFLDGYAMLDGESILRDNGVEIVKVQI